MRIDGVHSMQARAPPPNSACRANTLRAQGTRPLQVNSELTFYGGRKIPLIPVQMQEKDRSYRVGEDAAPIVLDHRLWGSRHAH